MKKLTILLLILLIGLFLAGCSKFSQASSSTKAPSNVEDNNSTLILTKKERVNLLFKNALKDENISSTTRKAIESNLKLAELTEDNEPFSPEEIFELKERKEVLQKNRKRSYDVDEQFLIDLNIKEIEIMVE